MLKKYKLIKEYPGSPKLGTVIINDYKFKGHWYISQKKPYKTTIHLGTIEPEKFPEFWEKVKEALFTTEDGYEIFEGETCWEVLKNFHLYEVNSHALPTLKTEIEKGTRKAFKKKENAEKYIEENEPVYSRKQVKEAFDNSILATTIDPFTKSCYDHINTDKFFKELDDV